MGKLIGFDVGEDSVKMAYFAGRELKKAVAVETPDAMVAGGRILSMDAMADFLKDMAKGNGIPLAGAAMVVPSTEVYTRAVTVPAMTEQQLTYNLPYEFRDFLTEEKNKYFFDYSVRRIRNDEEGRPVEMELLACAMLKSAVEEYRAMFRRAGFKLKALVPAECAYASLLQNHGQRTGAERPETCIVDLGYRSSNLYIYHGHEFDSRREIDIGSAQLDQLIADHCDVDIHVARNYRKSNFNSVLTADYAKELYGRIAVEVVKAVNFYNYNNRDRELTDVCFCGGDGNIAPLLDTVAERTSLKLYPADELLAGVAAPEDPWTYLCAVGGAFGGL